MITAKRWVLCSSLCLGLQLWSLEGREKLESLSPEMLEADGVSAELIAQVKTAESKLLKANDLITQDEKTAAKKLLDYSAESTQIAIMTNQIQVTEAEWYSIASGWSTAREKLAARKLVSDKEKKAAVRESGASLAKVRYEVLLNQMMTAKASQKLLAVKRSDDDVYIMDALGNVYVWKLEESAPTFLEGGSKDWRVGLSLLVDGDWSKSHGKSHSPSG